MIRPEIKIVSSPRGPQGPAGGILGPNPTVVDNIPVFNDITGAELKDSGKKTTDFVENSQIDTDVTISAPSNTKVACTQQVKTYADTLPDWKTLPALAWVSTDGSTNVVNATGNLTTILSPGMRVKTQQSQALTAYWSMDENSNTTVGSFNGTDTAITYTAGKFSNAATFNGTTSKIVIADNASLKPTGEFTIGCWFKTGTTGAAKAIFQSYSGNANPAGIYFQVSATNVLNLIIGKNTGTTVGVDYSSISGTTTVTDNSLHYAVISVRNNYAQIYLDGKLEVSSYCFTPAYAATNYVRVGMQSTTGNDISPMNGQIDDLFLINGYALDGATIAAKYAAATAQGTGEITVQKYALITAVAPYAAGVTPITIWGGTDYSLANATISSPYYATVSQPFGFDRSENKWKTEITSQIQITTNTPTANVWNNHLSLSIPIGKWKVLSAGNMGATGGAASPPYVFTTLSNANNTENDKDFSHGSGVAVNNIQIIMPFNKQKEVLLTAKTTHYLNISAGVASLTSIYTVGNYGSTIIRAVSSYI